MNEELQIARRVLHEVHNHFRGWSCAKKLHRDEETCRNVVSFLEQLSLESFFVAWAELHNLKYGVNIARVLNEFGAEKISKRHLERNPMGVEKTFMRMLQE